MSPTLRVFLPTRGGGGRRASYSVRPSPAVVVGVTDRAAEMDVVLQKRFAALTSLPDVDGELGGP